jgi:hypothetical protein
MPPKNRLGIGPKKRLSNISMNVGHMPAVSFVRFKAIAFFSTTPLCDSFSAINPFLPRQESAPTQTRSTLHEEKPLTSMFTKHRTAGYNGYAVTSTYDLFPVRRLPLLGQTLASPPFNNELCRWMFT